jgi:hypothetical protein
MTYRVYDLMSYLGNLLLGWPLDGFEATKEVGEG